MFQVCELTEELQIVKNQRDVLQTSKEEVLKVQADLDVSAQREKELKQQCDDSMQQLDLLHSKLEQSEAEMSKLIAFLEERDAKVP